MSFEFYNLDGVGIPNFFLPPSGSASVRVKNAATATVTMKCFLAGYDGAAAADVTNPNGKEIAGEGWVSVREVGDVAWTALNDPTFTDAYADLASNVFEHAMTAGSTLDLEFKVEVPDDPETSGAARFSVVFAG